MPPLITIGLTAYNAEQTLDAALASIFAQTWRPIEVIAVDDCSTDHTFELLQRYARSHPEMKVFRNEKNEGVAVSRNRILEEADGDFVAFFDDDDVSLPERVALQYRRITDYEHQYAEPILALCHTTRRVRYPDGSERIETTIGQNSLAQAPAGLAVARRILLGTPLKDGNGACPTCSQMGRLTTYQALGGFDPALRRGEDTDLNIRLARAGGHFLGMSDALVIQVMTRTADKSLSDEYFHMRRLLEKHRDFIMETGQYEFCLAWIHAKHTWLSGKRKAFAGELARLALRHPSLTFRRMFNALPNLSLNRAFSKFHLGGLERGAE